MQARLSLFALALALALAGCADQAASDDERFYTDQTMHDFMNKAMQPAAEGIWNRTGYLTNDDGFQTLFPQNAAEWQEAEHASLILAELSNVLEIPGREVDEREWHGAVEAVRITSLAAAEAARRQNEDDFMQASLALNNACLSCHERYARPE